MAQATPTLTTSRSSPSRAWVVTDGKVGMDVQVRGVADALGLLYDMKHVSPRGLWKIAAPWGPVAPAERFGRPGSPFAPPWPAVAIATGRASIPYIRALKRAAGDATYTVILQDPKTNAASADLIWVPAHDSRRGANVITTLTSPHSFTQDRLADLRGNRPEAIAALPGTKVAIILGGANAVYAFNEADHARCVASLRSLATLDVSFMITPSRRTHPNLLAAVAAATCDRPRLLWDGQGDNPYPQFLAQADLLIVTADSVNMCGEACATGRPVFVFTPSGGSPKFERFQRGLAECGATRPLPEHFDAITQWSYTPLDSAAMIAHEIRARWCSPRLPSRS